MIYDAYQKGPYRVPGWHDPDDKRLIGITFKPYQWSHNTVYSRYGCDDFELIVPAVFTGLYYKVKAPGQSGETEPDWVREVGEETADGSYGLIWEAALYNLMPITEWVTAVTYTTTDGVILSSESFNDYSCEFMIEPLPDEAIATGTFDITAHVIKSNGEEFDITLQFKIADR